MAAEEEKAGKAEAPEIGGKTLNLSADVGAIFREAVLAGRDHQLCLDAYQYCQVLNGNAKGSACPIRSLPMTRKPAGSNSFCLFSGRLAQLKLNSHAVGDSIDPGKCEAILSKINTVQDITEAIGPIIVNLDMVTLESTCVHAPNNSFVRANKDAEVVAACLCLYACKDDNTVGPAIEGVLNDLVFDGRLCGTGSAFTLFKIALLEKEESQRDVIGASGARKCLMVISLVEEAKAEKRDANCNTEVDIIMKILKEDGRPAAATLKSWSVDTARRFVMVGRRIKPLEIQRLIGLWEYHEKRNALIDSITILRAATQASQLSIASPRSLVQCV